MPTRENQQIICCLCSPLSPFLYQHMLISRQNCTGKRLIHLTSPPDIMSLAGNCTSCADLLCDISPPDIMSLTGNCISYAVPLSNISPLCAAVIARSSEEDERSRTDVGAEVLAPSSIPLTNETGTGPVTKTALSFEVICPDAMTVYPPWVSSHDSTSPGTPSLALPGSSHSKAVDAKAAVLSLSGGNFRCSVFVSRRRVRIRVRRRNRRSRCCHLRCVCCCRLQTNARYQQQGEDFLVVVAFVDLRESLGLINCVGSLLLAN